jgi:signal transduction histidine kinase
MKLKHQLAVFNAFTRILVLVILWFMLPFLVEKVIYRQIHKSLLEKNKKFMEHLDREEINEFLVSDDSVSDFTTFSTFHNEFIKLSRLSKKQYSAKINFSTESREIEGETSDFRISLHYFSYKGKNYQLEIGNSLSEIKELTFIIRFFILIVLGIILILTFLIDTFYIEYLLKPFYKIIDKKIRRVNQPDAFDYTSIVSHTKDFQELDLVLNQMMARIQELFVQEKQFIANVSHELLTPISLLKNRFENLMQNDSIDDNAQDKIVSSLKTLDTLKKIINNLLLISKIENNQFNNKESIVFLELIQNLLEELEDRLADKEIVIHFHFNHQFSFIGNRTLLHVLFFNLLINAIKYNCKGGSISIEDGFLEKLYFIKITDSGFGISEDQISKIFNRFERFDLNQDGLGLGLAIVNSIAQFHQIKIELHSELKKGSSFVLLFPSQFKT